MIAPPLLAAAQATLRDPRQAMILLPLAVRTGAVRLLDRAARAQAPRQSAAAIPRRIMQYWHAEQPPGDVRRAIEKVRDCNPGLVHEQFAEPAARAFIAQHFGAELASLFDACFHHTMKSDLFRLCYLYVHGGVYVDVDIDCHAPLTGLFVNNSFHCLLFYAQGEPWCIENGFIAAQPGSGVIAAMLAWLRHNLVLYRDRRRFRGIWQETGPGVATEAVMNLLARHIVSGESTELINGLLLSEHDLQTLSYCHDELQYKQTAEGNWRKAGPPPRHPL